MRNRGPLQGPRAARLPSGETAEGVCPRELRSQGAVLIGAAASLRLPASRPVSFGPSSASPSQEDKSHEADPAAARFGRGPGSKFRPSRRRPARCLHSRLHLPASVPVRSRRPRRGCGPAPNAGTERCPRSQGPGGRQRGRSRATLLAAPPAPALPSQDLRSPVGFHVGALGPATPARFPGRQLPGDRPIRVCSSRFPPLHWLFPLPLCFPIFFSFKLSPRLSCFDPKSSTRTSLRRDSARPRNTRRRRPRCALAPSPAGDAPGRGGAGPEGSGRRRRRRGGAASRTGGSPGARPCPAVRTVAAAARRVRAAAASGPWRPGDARREEAGWGRRGERGRGGWQGALEAGAVRALPAPEGAGGSEAAAAPPSRRGGWGRAGRGGGGLPPPPPPPGASPGSAPLFSRAPPRRPLPCCRAAAAAAAAPPARGSRAGRRGREGAGGARQPPRVGGDGEAPGGLRVHGSRGQEHPARLVSHHLGRRVALHLRLLLAQSRAAGSASHGGQLHGAVGAADRRGVRVHVHLWRRLQGHLAVPLRPGLREQLRVQLQGAAAQRRAPAPDQPQDQTTCSCTARTMRSSSCTASSGPW
nr:calcium-activated potassium channel subunit beta-4 isoform X1 [Oryctolagus cuniculus]